MLFSNRVEQAEMYVCREKGNWVTDNFLPQYATEELKRTEIYWH